MSHRTCGPTMNGILVRTLFIIYSYLPQQGGHGNASDSQVVMSTWSYNQHSSKCLDISLPLVYSYLYTYYGVVEFFR